MSQNIKIGVCGAGVFGGYHAHKCTRHARLDFIGIFDPNREAARRVADKYGVTPFSSYDDMLARVDAVIIACPAIHHGKMAIRALNAEIHCLIEKPIAATVSEAEDIAHLAKSRNLIVQVGHQERLVAHIIGLDQISERPKLIRSVRNTAYSLRGTDVSVTLDLMTHDIDLVCWLMDAAPTKINGQSLPRSSETADCAWAHLTFDSPFYPSPPNAFLESIRTPGQALERTMQLSYPSGEITLDFVAKTLTHTTPFTLNPDFGADPRAKDSLGAATDYFARAILNNDPVLASAEDGLRAVKIANTIDARPLLKAQSEKS